MGAIDDIDRLMAFHSTRLKSTKWWQAIFFFLINVSLINEWFLWKLENPDKMTGRGAMTLKKWLAGLVEEILDKYGWLGEQAPDEEDEDGEHDNHPDGKPGKHRGSHQGMPRADDVLEGTARLEQRHFPAKLEKRKNCALCYHTKPGDKSGEKQVMWQCEQCNVALHVPECFKKWHTHKKPRSSLV